MLQSVFEHCMYVNMAATRQVTNGVQPMNEPKAVMSGNLDDPLI